MNIERIWKGLGIFALLRHLVRIFEFEQVDEDNRGTIDPNG